MVEAELVARIQPIQQALRTTKGARKRAGVQSYFRRVWMKHECRRLLRSEVKGSISRQVGA